MERDFLVPDDFEDYVYVSQVLQAEGMGQAFYTHRISQPYCMGTLYWQLNDCWPVTSWSGLDYYGRWKALHYHVKRAYAPLMVRTFEDENGLHVFAVNDHPEGVALKLQLVLATFLGDTLMHEMKSISLSPQSNQRLYYYDSIPVDKTDKVFIAKLIQNDSVISTSYHYFVPSKELDLDDPAITYSISGNEGRYVVRVKTKKLARQVFLEAKGAEGHFSDNFFDMAAGETRWISFNGEIAEGELNDRLKIKTLYETY
jgi:beta-mannosidase